MKNILKNKKGITLVSMVVTIILLLILAGVSIRTLGGENGLIKRTQIAKEENKKSEYKDYLSIAKTEAIVKKGGVEVTLDEYIEQIKADKIEGIKSIEKITNDKASVITKEGYIFIITVNTIEYYENENTLPEMNIKDANIEFVFDPNTWTNKKVEVTVSKKENKYTLQLSKNAEKWATTNKMTFEENGEIYARLIDELGRTSDIASRKITKIDKEKPEITEVTPSTNSVRIKATDNAAGIIGYAVTTSTTVPTTFIECESTKELDVTVEDLKQGTTYYAWVKDAAGNVSESKEVTTGSVTGLEIKADTTNWSTSKTITITATNSNYSNIRYTTDGTIPTSTTGTAISSGGSFTITSNCTIIAVAFDSTGQAGSAATNKITKIDREKPVVTSATPSTNSVRIKATDDAAGIIGYAVTTSTTAPTAFTKCDSTKSLDVTVSNLTQGTTYYAWVKDAAGNVSEGKSTATGSVAGLEIKVNTTNWSTSKTITITAADSNYSNIRYTTDRTIPTSTTGTAISNGGTFTITSNCTITAVAFDSAGQAGSVATNKITTIDTEKPTEPTISVTSGTVGNNNYYRSNVTVKITAGTDSQSGVNRTTYVLSGSTAKSETTISSGGTITISNEGTTAITAYTYDNVNKKSNAKTLTIKKDATPPTVTALFSENTTQALVRLDLKDDNGVSSIKVGSTTTDTKNQKNWIYDMYTSTDGSTKITVTDVAGNTTTKTYKIKFLYTQNNLRTENTGGWNQNYYKEWSPDNITYSSDGGLFVLANPTSSGWGRVGTWYTSNSINLSEYDTIRSVSWMNKNTTGIIQLGLARDIQDTADLNKAKLQNDYDGSSGYWTRLQANISSRNDSQQIVIGTNGEANQYIHMFLTNMYMYSFK